jgi:hypothetical protein
VGMRQHLVIRCLLGAVVRVRMIDEPEGQR